jgi:hypothetical protein
LLDPVRWDAYLGASRDGRLVWQRWVAGLGLLVRGLRRPWIVGSGLVGSGLVWVGLLVSSDTFTEVFEVSKNGVDF